MTHSGAAGVVPGREHVEDGGDGLELLGFGDAGALQPVLTGSASRRHTRGRGWLRKTRVQPSGCVSTLYGFFFACLAAAAGVPNHLHHHPRKNMQDLPRRGFGHSFVHPLIWPYVSSAFLMVLFDQVLRPMSQFLYVVTTSSTSWGACRSRVRMVTVLWYRDRS